MSRFRPLIFSRRRSHACPADGVGTLDGLGVDQPGRRLGDAALMHAQRAMDRGQDLLGDLGLFPLVDLPVHGLPRRKVDR